MGQLVLDLEKRGYIERRADPLDRRATLVLFTCTGWQFLRDAYEIRRGLKTEYQAIIGEEGMSQLRATLMRLLEKAEFGGARSSSHLTKSEFYVACGSTTHVLSHQVRAQLFCQGTFVEQLLEEPWR